MTQAVRRVAALAAATLSFLVVAQALACESNFPGARRAESSRYVVAYRMKPVKPAVSAHFSIELVVCAKAGEPAPDSVRVDARMPEHGHGMNYRAEIKSLGSGHFQADGLLFHMPGRWEIVFDVRSGDASDRITHDFVL